MSSCPYKICRINNISFVNAATSLNKYQKNSDVILATLLTKIQHFVMMLMYILPISGPLLQHIHRYEDISIQKEGGYQERAYM